ncbi:MAG: DUF1565 domain-containing protein, partial [Caldilineaceae bacterium]|nr:DUF1565 domain-containing protein [Caldilineaceae bacterium]
MDQLITSSSVESTAIASGRAAFAVQNTPQDAFQSGADRLASLQNTDGGWDWPLDDGNPGNASPRNTIAPIGMGLAQAYLHTGDPAHLAALQQAGALLLTKTNNFSPPDGYLAAILDQIFGGTTYLDHVTTNFYAPLAAGTYDRNGDGTLYDTAGMVNLIRTNRVNQNIPNLAAWDVGMGLVGAAIAGADTTEWIVGAKGEIEEIDNNDYYDVIGLAGALYGLAAAGEEFDPAAGPYAAATNLMDLANILVGYQIAGGGFTWNANYVIPNDDNETVQETAYAALALNAVSRSSFGSAIRGAADWLVDAQLPTGGWGDQPSSENNELTGEALWAISFIYPEVWVDPIGNDANDGSKASPFATIQKGVTEVASGGTVHVNAGTYAENVTINKALTLNGAQANVPVGGRTPAGAAESTLQGQLDIAASNVEVNGMSFTNPGQTRAIYVPSATPSHSDITIAFNIIDNIGGSGVTSGVKALYVNRGPDNVSILNNRISNVQGDAKSTDAISILDSASTDPSEGLLIQGNAISNIISGPGTPKGAYGVMINNGAGAPSARILGNSFSNLSGGWTHAVGLEAASPDVVVLDNTFDAITATGLDKSAVFFEVNPVGDTAAILFNQFNGSDFFGVAI